MSTQKDLASRLDSLLTRFEPVVMRMQQIPTGSEDSSLSEKQLAQIEAAISRALDSRTAEQAHHDHGGDPHCEGCLNLINHQLNVAYGKGMEEMRRYYEDIPGVKNARETYEQGIGEDDDVLILVP